MIRFFKTLQPATLVIVPIVVLIFWARIFNHAGPVSDAKVLPIWQLLASFLKIFPSWINFILVFCLISGTTIYLNLLLNRYEVLYKNTFIPALICTLFVSCIPEIIMFHPVHVVNIILLLIISRLFPIYKSEFPVSALFDCGFLAATASLIYFPAFIIIPLLLTAQIFLRNFRIKEWLITLVGILLPYFFVSIFLFWNHELIGFWKNYFAMFKILRPEFVSSVTIQEKILGFSILALLLFSLVKLRLNFRKNVVRTRNNQLVLFIMLLFGAGWLLLTEKIEYIHLVFFMIPCSVFCSYVFVAAKRKIWIYEYILWGLVILIIWNHML